MFIEKIGVGYEAIDSNFVPMTFVFLHGNDQRVDIALVLDLGRNYTLSDRKGFAAN